MFYCQRCGVHEFDCECGPLGDIVCYDHETHTYPIPNFEMIVDIEPAITRKNRLILSIYRVEEGYAIEPLGFGFVTPNSVEAK